jgi:hypothetical protein
MPRDPNEKRREDCRTEDDPERCAGQIAAGRSASELRSDEFEMAFNRGEVYLADGGVLPTSAGVLAGARR